jgi:hypothetical protein
LGAGGEEGEVFAQFGGAVGAPVGVLAKALEGAARGRRVAFTMRVRLKGYGPPLACLRARAEGLSGSSEAVEGER